MERYCKHCDGVRQARKHGWKLYSSGVECQQYQCKVCGKLSIEKLETR